MKLLFHVLTMLALVRGQGDPVPETPQVTKYHKDLYVCKSAGGPSGKSFEDTDIITAGQTLTTLKLCGAERLDGIGVTIVSETNESHDSFHGSERNCSVYPLASNEYIVSYEVNLANMYTPELRIGLVKLYNQKGDFYTAGRHGRYSDNFFSCAAPEGYKLAGFLGRSGEEVDALSGLWKLI